MSFKDYMKDNYSKEDKLWHWIERIREYLLTLEVWRDIDEKNWKEITTILIGKEVKK